MSDFSIDFVSRNDFQHLAVEIYYKKQRLCQLNKENGREQVLIEFVEDIYVLPDNVKMRFPLSEFLSILEEAKRELCNCP